MNCKTGFCKKAVSVALVLALMLSCVLCTAMPVSAYATMEEAASAAAAKGASTFSWDNATVYFLLTDRFNNGDTSNDHSYGRGLDENGNVVQGVDPSATFHGGDFAGITEKIEEGYFTDLGVNAIWLSAPYEQIHGYVVGGDGNPSFPHYAYHGYYAMDYTNTDANFGTAEEFRTLVDTAHKNGIRIVMDIVLNHAGYNTIKDMAEYDFGTLKSGWESYYYSQKNVNNTDYHSFIDYETNASDWGNWWGDDWVRAGLAGYGGSGSGEVTGCLAGLPDFKTESTKSVTVPAFLQNKWKGEGRYTEQMQKLDQYFSKTGKAKTVTNYLAFWLSEWVREYGVDGFRCDTAKHVELASWKNLKNECVSALREWKQNNPDKALDNLDFWMTGEHWDHGVGKDDYYSNGFDSMINFSTQGGGLLAKGQVGGVYKFYADAINSDPDFNVLSYVSSHDSVIATGDKIHMGSAFLLLPGGVQIFYGDETDRPVESGYQSNGDHEVRGDMNWSSMNTATLEHWQTVGRFRNNHIAVGGGSHADTTATNGYAFTRAYNKNGITDKVAAVIDANSNTSVTVDVSSLWKDGTTVVNAYDDDQAEVTNGKVTFNSGKNGTILIEEPSGMPLVSLKGESEFTGTQDVTVSIKNADYAIASVDGAQKVKVFDGDKLTIGATAYAGDTVKVTLKATNDLGTTNKNVSFKKLDPNEQGTKIDHALIHVQQAEGYTGNPMSLYVWQDNNGTTTPLGGWPGTKLTEGKLEDGWYTFELKDVKGSYNLIVNNSIVGSGQMQSGDITGLEGETWISVESDGSNFTAKPVTAQAEDKTPMGMLKKETREVKNFTASDFTADTLTPVYNLVPQADAVIAKGGDASDSEVNAMLNKMQAAKRQLKLKAPAVNNVKNGATAISGKAPCESTVTIKSGTKTYTAAADELTGAWSAQVSAVANASAVTVSCERSPYKSATIYANDSEEPGTDPTLPTQPPTEKPTERPTDEPQPGFTYMLGDVDEDGVITVADVLSMQNYLAAKIRYNEKMILIADVDRSGGVTLVDILEMQKYIAKMATSCEIGKIFGTEEPTQAPTARPTDPTQAPTEKPTEAPTEQPTDKPADSYTVYLKNAAGWSAPYAYYWNEGTKADAAKWPGTAMEKVGADTYKVIVPKAYDSIVFSNNGTAQSADLKIPADGKMFNNASGAWSDYAQGGDTPVPDTRTVYAENANGWDCVTAYYWVEGDTPLTWPGVQMEQGADGRYFVEIPQKYTKIIFSYNGKNQTDDLQIPGANACFDIGSGSWK